MAKRALGLLVLLVVAHQQGRSGYHLLASWEARWYARIAEDGYGFSLRHLDGRLLADYAFFPLLPLLERCLGALIGLSAEATGLAISTGSSVAAAAGIFAVARLVIGSRAAVLATVLAGPARHRRVVGVFCPAGRGGGRLRGDLARGAWPAVTGLDRSR